MESNQETLLAAIVLLEKQMLLWRDTPEGERQGIYELISQDISKICGHIPRHKTQVRHHIEVAFYACLWQAPETLPFAVYPVLCQAIFGKCDMGPLMRLYADRMTSGGLEPARELRIQGLGPQLRLVASR